MKIVLVTAGMSGGGTERVIAVLANYMVKHKYQVKIVLTANTEVAYKLDSSIETISLGTQSGGRILKRIERIKNLRKHFAENEKQVIVSFGTETNLFSILANAGLKNKLVISERNDPNKCKFKFLRNILYIFADTHVFQTEEAKMCFSKNIRKKSSVIPNPIKEEIPMPFEGIRDNRIVAVGRLQPQKNHKLLVDAFAQFSQMFPQYTLVIYGKGELEYSIKEQAEKRGIADKVILPGFSDNILEEIKSASMYILSSDYEGISNSLMEAMSIGLPTISTNCPIGGAAMLIQDKINGLLVPVNDYHALFKAMEKIATNDTFARKIGHNATKIKEQFSSQKICKKWMDEICR